MNLLVLMVMAASAAPVTDADNRARIALAQAIAQLPPKGYAAMRSRAIVENRPLYVWVDLSMPEIEAARNDAIHFHCLQFPEASSPCLIVARPRSGELWREVDLPARAVDAVRSPTTPIRICTPNGCQDMSAPNY